MIFLRRIGYFLLLNFLVLVTLQLVYMVVAQIWPQASEFHYTIIFALVVGMGGSLISLQMSRWMAIRFMNVRLVDVQNTRGKEQSFCEMVTRLSQKAGLPLPQMGIYPSPEVNAFATGPSASRALVAVSQGLLDKMSHDEMEGVVAHELAHIKNGDMVTMALLQGVVNVLVLIMSRVAAQAISSLMRDRDRGGEGPFGHFTYFVSYMICYILFSALGSLVVLYFSRIREFRADEGGAQLAGKGSMIGALKALQNIHFIDPAFNNESLSSFKISSPKKRSTLARLFSSHPPLEERISRLEGKAL